MDEGLVTGVHNLGISLETDVKIEEDELQLLPRIRSIEDKFDFIDQKHTYFGGFYGNTNHFAAFYS